MGMLKLATGGSDQRGPLAVVGQPSIRGQAVYHLGQGNVYPVQTTVNLFSDQPLVMGALAIAVGAAIGGLLPHTQIEDDALGATSDRLFAEAQRVFREERQKAMQVIKAAATEATGALKDTGAELADLLPAGKTAGNVIVDQISDAARRVSNTAKEEAARQGLTTERQS
jgi:hypothetical protein